MRGRRGNELLPPPSDGSEPEAAQIRAPTAEEYWSLTEKDYANAVQSNTYTARKAPRPEPDPQAITRWYQHVKAEAAP
ncbi:hypothetical protein GCM10010177_12600 [Actinomadura citrea]|nr:hypothetical protein GCM10010177_12600 [Actinomadura citrea]